jgi:hypothetical protein
MAGSCSDGRGSTTDELMKKVLERMTSANAWLRDLECALQTDDRQRVIRSAAKLHDIWAVVETTIAELRERALSKAASPRERWHYEVSYNTLLAGRYFARESLMQTWAMLQGDIDVSARASSVDGEHPQRRGSVKP